MKRTYKGKYLICIYNYRSHYCLIFNFTTYACWQFGSDLFLTAILLLNFTVYFLRWNNLEEKFKTTNTHNAI